MFKATSDIFSQKKLNKLLKIHIFRVVFKDFLERHLEEVFHQNKAFQRKEEIYRHQVSELLRDIEKTDLSN